MTASDLIAGAGRVHAGAISLGYETWPGTGPVVVGIHGLASHRGAFRALAEELTPDAATVIAFDLRGRGDADAPDGSFGMAQHAQDVSAALDELGIDQPVVVAGHSMGAYIASSFAAQFPARTAAVVLIDGGLPGARTDIDPDILLEVVLGDYLKRLHAPVASVDELLASVESTPLYAGRIDDSVRRYFQQGLSGEPGSFHSKVNETAIRADWRDILVSEASWTNPGSVSQPALLIRALDGLTGMGDQVIADHTRDGLLALIPHLQVADLQGENHHTLLTTRVGAAKTATAVRGFLQRMQG